VKKISKTNSFFIRNGKKKGDIKSKELYLTKKKEAKRAVAEAMEKEGKKTIEEWMCNKSEVLKLCM